MVNIRDVAKAAGVSASTVSLVLNHRAQEYKISPETQQRVLDAAAALHYTPRSRPHPVRLGDNSVTLCIYTEMDYSSNFILRMVNGIRTQMAEQELELNTLISPFIKNRLEEKLTLQNNRTLQAAIIAAPYVRDTAYLEHHKLSIPFVLYNRASDRCNTVEVDNYAVGQKAAAHLADCGIRTAGVVSASPGYAAMRQRTGGFEETCALRGIPIPPDFRLKADNSQAGGYAAGECLAAMADRPRALFCDSDAIAQGLVCALIRHGVRVPQDVGVVAVGMGDPRSASFSIPSITTVDIPHEEMCARSVELLLAILRREVSGIRHITCESRLIIRETSPLPG